MDETTFSSEIVGLWNDFRSAGIPDDTAGRLVEVAAMALTRDGSFTLHREGEGESA